VVAICSTNSVMLSKSPACNGTSLKADLCACNLKEEFSWRSSEQQASPYGF